MAQEQGQPGDVEELRQLADVMFDSSFCGLGQSVPIPMRSALDNFTEAFQLQNTRFDWESARMSVKITIDGMSIEAKEGTRLLDVARQNGVHIPTLCYHRDLSPTGNCRMCVVEVQGARFLQAACVTTVWDGMVVTTNSPRVMRDRQMTLEMMLANHPQDCLVCDASGSCELQDLAYEYQVEVPAWGSKGTRFTVDSDPNPFVRVDFNKCILCRRCVQACAEVQGRFVWGVANRGFDEVIVAGAGTTMLEARCESCGQCVAYCPTGALSDKMSYGLGPRSPDAKGDHNLCLLRGGLPV